MTGTLYSISLYFIQYLHTSLIAYSTEILIVLKSCTLRGQIRRTLSLIWLRAGEFGPAVLEMLWHQCCSLHLSVGFGVYCCWTVFWLWVRGEVLLHCSRDLWGCFHSCLLLAVLLMLWSVNAVFNPGSSPENQFLVLLKTVVWFTSTKPWCVLCQVWKLSVLGATCSVMWLVQLLNSGFYVYWYVKPNFHRNLPTQLKILLHKKSSWTAGIPA